MTVQERADIVKANISSVKVGDTFPTASALINKLGLPKETGNKENTKAVLSFLTWKTTGKLNKAGKQSKEIVITSIVKDPSKVTIEDKRADNRGGNNEKYAPFIKDAIMNYSFDPFNPMTTKEIIRDVLGYDFMRMSIKYKSKWKDLYFDKMRRTLSDSLRKSLEALDREKKIIYRYSYFIKPLHSFGYGDFTFPAMDKTTTMYEFICDAYSWAIDILGEKDVMVRFTSAFNKYAGKIYSLKRLTVYQFLKKLSEGKFGKSFNAMMLEKHELLELYWPYTEPAEYDIQEVYCTEARFFDSLRDLCHDIYGFSLSDTSLNPTKRKKVYELCDYMYGLLSFDSVWKANYIKIIAKPSVIKKHKKRTPNETVKEINNQLEDTMAHFAAHKKIDSIDKKTTGYHRYLFGIENVPIDYFMAFDKTTNDMHCDIFDIKDKDDYLIKQNSYCKAYLAKGHTVAELKSLPAKAKKRYDKMMGKP